jgi:hypothetical protein
MARKSNPVAELVESAPLPEQQINTAQLAAAATTDQARNWIHAAQAGGVLQAMSFIRTVADSALIDMYANVKKSKSYVGMPYTDEHGKPATVATVEEYCRIYLGKSYRRCEELLANRDLLGAELYDQTEKVGLRQRDYNAIKALPADDLEVIKQAVEDGADRDTVIEKLVTLAERQQAERLRLSNEVQKARVDFDVKEKRIADLSADLNKQHERTDKAQRKWISAKPNERQKIFQAAVMDAEAAIIADLGNAKNGLRAAVLALAEHCHEEGLQCGEFLGDTFGRLLNAVRTVRDDERAGAVPIVHDRGEDA